MEEELKEGFIFLYSDVLFNSKIINGILKNEGDICLAIKKDGLREEAEKVIENNGLIGNISKNKIEGENGEFIGIAKLSKEGSKKLIEELNATAKENLNASFIDIDFPEDLKKAEKLF